MMFHKGFIVAMLFLYFAIITLMAQSLGLTPSVAFIEDIGGVTGDGGFGDFVLNIGKYMAVFFSMLSFNVDLPFMVTLLFIHVPLVLLVWFIAELVRGT